MAMARCIVENARDELLQTYPSALYKDEEVDTQLASSNPKVYKYPLSVNVLEEHQAFFAKCQK